MNKQILSVLLVSLSILGFSQGRKSVDSLAGFNYAGALEHASHMKTDKEKKDFMDHAKRTYKISNYKLMDHNAINIGRNGQAFTSVELPTGANLHPNPNTIMQGPQPTGCTNIDFEGGNTASWTVAGDFLVTNSGTDPYGGFPKVYPGGTNSLRLNDDNITGKVNFSANATRVIPVTAANNQFQLHFAFCILNFPHPANAAAVFKIEFFNAANVQLACPTFSCYYANPPGQFFGMPASVVQTSSVTGKNIGNQTYPVTYVNWQTIAMDLSPYNGQNITAKITCNWCLYNYDWGYCYIDADCAAPNFVPTNNPCGPMPQLLTGPIGMQSYTWTPPGGGTPVPTQTMNATVPGVYTLQCTPFTTCAATQTYTFAVGGAPPTANFISAPACINAATGFTSTSLPGGSAITSYTWNFGDGSPVVTATNTTQSHTYTTGGPKPVKLIITNAAGCRDSITINVTPVPSPIASFNFTTACVNSPLQFVDNTNLNGGPAIAGYTWQWNDATPNGNTPTATHIYTTSTPKSVQLVVVNSSGCRDSITKNFNINPAPIVNWTANNVCYGAPTIFNNNTNPNGSNVTIWNWDLNGDMITDNTQQSPNFIYPASGIYNVGLIAITNLGCSDTMYQTVSVFSKPIARFAYTKTCFGDPTQFIDNSYVVGTTGVINQWGWDIDNNINTIEGTLQNAMLTYPSAGPHTANLIVTTNFGCKDTATMTMFVNVTPQADFVADKTQGCSKLPVRFTSQSHIAYGSIASYAWNLGDHAGSADTTAYHIYPAGTYTVKLEIVSDSGCYAERTIPAYIHSWPVPVADYTVSPQTTDILEPYVNFTNLTQGSFSNWWWYFGDKPQADTATMHPVHYYDSDYGNNYLTTLIVKNQYGCYDTTQRLVVVEPNFVIYVPNAFTPNGDGINDIFYAKGYYLDKFEMNIYDRWGELVYTSNDIHKGWDGNVKGKGVASENTTYVWKITTVDTQKRRKELTGHVTLIK